MGISRGWFDHFLLSCCVVAAVGCGGRATRESPPKWEFGYWFWEGSSAAIRASAGPLDVVYVQAGGIEFRQYDRSGEPWSVHAYLPGPLPPAREYWAVIRFDLHAVPDLRTVPLLAGKMAALREEAREAGLQLAGIQLDIDSPTRSLPEYAKYLQALRKDLPGEMQISITALLDWFRPGTAVGNLVSAVDEFVPQFYDLGNARGVLGGPVIAAPIDAGSWSPVFNRFGKRFRIGISTFGRSRAVSNGREPRYISFHDLRPLDLGLNPDFVMESSTTPAKELLLRYRSVRETKVAYQEFEAGAVIEFVLSTPEAVRAAVGEARRMGEYCAGVVFFRWPSFNESLTARPDEVLTAAGATAVAVPPTTLRVVDEECAAVNCADLFLMHTPSLKPTPVRYVIRVSQEMEYFLPDEKRRTRMRGPSTLEFTLPPYSGRTQVHLGRAVTSRAAQYALEVHE